MIQPHDHDPLKESEKKQTAPHEETVKKLELVAKEAGPEAVHDYMRELLEDDSPETEAERSDLRRAITDYYAKDFVLEATHEGENLTNALQGGAMEAEVVAASARQIPEMMRLSDTLMRLGGMEEQSGALIRQKTHRQTEVDGYKNGEKPIPDVLIKKFNELFEDGTEEARNQFAEQEVDWTRLNQITDSLDKLSGPFALLRHFAHAIKEYQYNPQAVGQEIPRIKQTLLDLRNHLATTL